jgi:hypothetical protein
MALNEHLYKMKRHQLANGGVKQGKLTQASWSIATFQQLRQSGQPLGQLTTFHSISHRRNKSINF